MVVTMATRLAVLVAVALYSAGAEAINFDHVFLKFAFWDGYYTIPTTENEAKNDKHYCYMEFDKDLNCSLWSYCGDPRVSILYDSYGNIGGIRTAYIKDDVAKRAQSKNLTFPYDFNSQPMFKSGNYLGFDLWYTSALFVSPEKLKAGGRSDTKGLVAEDVYLLLGNEENSWTKISRDECQVEAQGFEKQACFLGMGMHYFYKMTPTVDCAKLPGIFLLYESKDLIGLGIIPFGSFTKKDREWFEDPPSSVVKKIVPNRPDCLTEWVDNYGTSSLHIFFKHHPRLTFCIWPWQKDVKTCEHID